ncbi:MAG: (Fe-S)-binding protein [Lutibacter sp.]|nr:(Fe-S)-binding protein [Lutibacter sp.]MBP9600745.1 (Fe-S)-binding protein [Lutibacter sp.]
MNYIDNIVFLLLLIIGIGFFTRNIKRVIRNIQLGKTVDRKDQSAKRWENMARIALGQSKMVKRPISGILHILVYVGFIIINIEVIEIIIDGLFGTHRVLSFLGGFYHFLIGTFEVLALLVLISVSVFWVRRMILKIPRFWNKEMKGFPKNDALYILYIEMVLMTLFLVMNATDVPFQQFDEGNPISQFLVPFFENFNAQTLFYIERTSWWLHITGILLFLNYLYYSKHLHILLAFPNTYFANLDSKGKLTNLESVTNEVKMMLDPSIDPFAAIPEGQEMAVPEKFGASDVTDLNWVQLLNAYTCTECGRCTSVCPANQTGKELSPRAIMMKTRDRLEEVGENINKNGAFVADEKQLLYDFISPEEIWACTSCNACVEECPVNIDPLSIIIDLRRYLVMEQSAAPQELNTMMSNIENNGAPWKYNQMDRLNWKNE